ncbi:MAG: Glu/Leu/Phe/Val dehydrogenase, partial [Herbaspirillum sp.]
MVTGKPISLGGSLGRREATGRGVFVVGSAAAALRGLEIKGAKIAVQGYGNVGGTAAKLFVEAGAKLVAVQDHMTTIVNPGGINALALFEHVKLNGSVQGFAGATEITDSSQFWGVDCDILIPAALEQQINETNANQIRAKIILEGANGPTSPGADDILQDR